MGKAASIHTRIDPELKKNAEKIIHALGLNPSQAINAFYAQIVQFKGIPFDLRLPSKETLEAMNELESGKVKTYDSMQNLWNDLDNDE